MSTPKILLLVVSGTVCLIAIAWFCFMYWKMCRDEDRKQETEKKAMQEEYERRKREITHRVNGRFV